MLSKSGNRLIVRAFAESSLIDGNEVIFFVIFQRFEDISPPDPWAEIAMNKNQSLFGLRIEFDIINGLTVRELEEFLFEGHETFDVFCELDMIYKD